MIVDFSKQITKKDNKKSKEKNIDKNLVLMKFETHC